MFRKDLSQYGDVAHLLLRLALAAAFLFHGLQKWSLWTAAPEGMSPTMLGVMKTLSVVEPLAGLAMLVGVFTQLAGVAIAVIMIGAISFKLSGQFGPAAAGFASWEMDMLLFVIAIAVVIEGAGRFSLEGKRM